MLVISPGPSFCLAAGRGAYAIPACHPLPSVPSWLHEIKHDGFRLMARRDAAGARLFTRNGIDWSARFPLIVQAVAAPRARSCLIDGEAVAPLKKIPPAGERGGIVGGPRRGRGRSTE